MAESTRSCPHCQAVIPETAKMCASCWREVETGKQVVFDTKGRHAQVSGKVVESSLSVVAAESSVEKKTKPCMHCQAPVPEQMLICPACGLMQDSEFLDDKPVRHIRRRRRWRAPAVLLLVAIAGFATFWMLRKPEQARELGEDIASRLPAPIQRLVDPESSSRAIDAPSESGARTRQPDLASPSSGVEPQSQLPRAISTESAPRARPSDTVIEIACPSCNGVGRHNIPDSSTRTYRCPVCNGAGKRNLRLRAGGKVCGTCRGMGKTGRQDELFRKGNRVVADRCQDCRGTGIAPSK